MRKVLAIPLSEVKAQFEKNTRQDVKVVSPKILSKDLFEVLKAKGKTLKEEKKLEGDTWLHSNPNEPNNLIESNELDFPTSDNEAGIAIAFSTEKANQDTHYHTSHAKILYSEHHLEIKYRMIDETEVKHIDLTDGGLIFIAPNVIHFQIFHGLTLVLEYPGSVDDKIVADL